MHPVAFTAWNHLPALARPRRRAGSAGPAEPPSASAPTRLPAPPFEAADGSSRTLLRLQPGWLAADVVPAYPASRSRPAELLALPWPLKPLGSAHAGASRLADGRISWWIRHAPLRGVSPPMLAWWFAHLEGDVTIGRRRINRYRLWHPHDHVHASYAWRRADGTVGPGAAIRLREFLGANPAYEVNVTSVIERLDAGGFVHCPLLHGVQGLARMEYRFTAVPGGTLYENRLIVGGSQGWRRALNPLLQRWLFDRAHGLAWLRHNIEEVGQLERFLPALYAAEHGEPLAAATAAQAAPPAAVPLPAAAPR